IAAVNAIAALARKDVPDEVDAAYSGRRLRYGPDYIIPVPFDPRLISSIPPAVAKAAMDSGVARKPIIDINAYKRELAARLDPASAGMQTITEAVKANPKRVVFAEGEEEKQIRAAVAFSNAGLGHPILLGREERVRETMKNIGLPAAESLEIINSRISPRTKAYTDMLYSRMQRRGALYRDVQRMVNQERNIFGSLMVQAGDADAMVTGLTRNYWQAFEEIKKVIDPAPGELLFGMTVFVVKGKLVFVADTTVHETPTPEQLADIAVQTAHKARQMGHEPRVAMISYSNFGNPSNERADRVREAVGILDARKVDFDYDGEMAADVALDPELLSHFPFCRLKEPANVLVMPGLYSATIASKLLQKLGGVSVIGPILVGLAKPVQITSMDATANDIVNMAVLACHEALT
ncbi:MAG: NADP-dependent malic enzyme, partial [Magnetospirillum sp.]|nr:NADP-dependent malic enzyme [Magnetospirillum sp.]